MRLILFFLKCVVGLLASIGFLVVIGSIVLGVIVTQLEPFEWEPTKRAEIPDSAVLTLDFAGGLIEDRPDNPLSRASLGDPVVLREAIDALEAAGRDDRVKGLVARVGRGGLGLADVQELRDAVIGFRESGKFAVAFAESFGEGGNGTLHYYLASAFDSIWLQPSGDLDVTGIMLESPYLREALDEIGVTPRFDQREDYKGVMNMFTDSRLPEKQRQNLQRLTDSWLSQISQGIAAERKIAPARLISLIDRAPFLASEAVVHGLVDVLGYWDQVNGEVMALAGDDATFLELTDYAAAREQPNGDGPVIALVYGLGPVVLDSSENDPVFGEVAMGSDTVSEALADAIDDADVQAIVFRVDSPGGSYVASDVIWREMQRAREADLPVIVSMGNIAASGGYFVAAPAHRIVAQPGTLTGSIGVAAGKLVLDELWAKLGITWDGVQSGANADIWSMNRDFSPEGWQRLQTFLDAVYEDFTTKVAEGRNISIEAAREAAQGQVWSGEDARSLGLVDALGGYRQAIALAREAAGLADDEPIQIKRFPQVRDPFEALFEDVLGTATESPGVRAMARGLARIAKALAPLVEATAYLTGDPRARTLQTPPLRLSN